MRNFSFAPILLSCLLVNLPAFAGQPNDDMLDPSNTRRVNPDGASPLPSPDEKSSTSASEQPGQPHGSSGTPSVTKSLPLSKKLTPWEWRELWNEKKEIREKIDAYLLEVMSKNPKKYQQLPQTLAPHIWNTILDEDIRTHYEHNPKHFGFFRLISNRKNALSTHPQDPLHVQQPKIFTWRPELETILRDHPELNCRQIAPSIWEAMYDDERDFFPKDSEGNFSEKFLASLANKKIRLKKKKKSIDSIPNPSTPVAQNILDRSTEPKPFEWRDELKNFISDNLHLNEMSLCYHVWEKLTDDEKKKFPFGINTLTFQQQLKEQKIILSGRYLLPPPIPNPTPVFNPNNQAFLEEESGSETLASVAPPSLGNSLKRDMPEQKDHSPKRQRR